MEKLSAQPPALRPPTARISLRQLAGALEACIRGEVRFDIGSRALYSTDASNYRQLALGVVLPRDEDDVLAAVDVCRQFGAPLLPRGGGTSLAGQTCNTAVVLDMSKYMCTIGEIDADRRLARVQPGVILDDLRDAAERYALTFGPDPATHNRCTLGGMIGNDSCGTHSVMAGKTVDNVEELDILTYDGLRMTVGRTGEEELGRIIATGGRRGEIYAGLRAIRDKYSALVRERFPRIPRRVSGYNLDQLLPENGFNVARALVGTEGTCVTILGATLRLVASPPARVLVVLGYGDVVTAGRDVPEILEYGPIGLEGMDGHLVAAMRKKHLNPAEVALLPEGDAWLLIEFGGGTADEARERAHKLVDAFEGRRSVTQLKLVEDRGEQAKMWLVRESALGAEAIVPGERDAWPGWEDSAVPPERVGDYLGDLRRLLDRYDYRGAFYGHFGQGCIHLRVDFDFATTDGIAHYRAFMEDAADVVISYGGSLSGEHGDGQARAELLPKMFGAELTQAFREFTALWDPRGKMNPGKVVDPYRMDEHLRLGSDYRPRAVSTHFHYPEDDGSFAHATVRCVGVGRCRRMEGGTMCPSYMVTREEKHSTRGRARLLFEMLHGEALADGWRNESVREALDLCLACKGCKGDCPVNVDMATYKAEFLAHYYAGRLRPMTAYSMGLIHRWARLAAIMPGLANGAMRAPLLGRAAKAVAGIAQDRRVPEFAPHTFKDWFRQRDRRNQDRPAVLLWPDTFNNHFHPETASAAVEVLEAAGYRVIVPQRPLCCGRPLYDYGMLDLAKRLLRQILDALRPEIAAGVPLVALEPSCLAVFRDELVNLMSDDEDAQRLSRQSYLLSEFLAQHVSGFELPQLHRKALVHGHCHQKSLVGTSDEESLLHQIGVEYTAPDAGCCGMAGAFGFEREHYGVSMAVGERVLLPAVRAADDETLIVADGFSCREQIAQSTGRRALHLAELLQLALRESRGEISDERIMKPSREKKWWRWAAPVAGLAIVSGILLGKLRPRR
ncbi:MAG TPA: FAD-binding and (Fe-S)-binding domain-containing protein [Ktedonobacterales bacterium]|jgi:FAD/FMN-containing dehydrogenase/Fe-S oxidoreductase|nr:FAD-binding and (Fe-S)-binding domain-containing protein [Ktedonobacterales bacterium]